MIVNINKILLDNFQNIKQFSSENIKNIIKEIDIENAIKLKNTNRIINYIIVIYAINTKHTALDKLKKDKIFSLNINSKNKEKIKIIDFLLKNQTQLEIRKEDITYFESKRNLFLASEDIYTISQKIRKEVKEYGNTFVRDILFYNDMYFYQILKQKITPTITVESLSEICSYLIYLFAQINKEHIISEKTFSLENVNHKIHNLILLSSKIINFQNIEKFVDNFNYICKKEKNNLFITSDDNLLEKSRRYGDFYSNKQREFLLISTIKKYKSALSIRSIIDMKCFKNLFTFNKDPIERYIFKFVISDEIRELVCKKEYFLEELIELEEIKKEYFIDDFDNFKISNSLTIRDLIKVKRLFSIFGFINSNFLFNILDKDKTKIKIIYNSWIKAFQYDQLKVLLVNFIQEDKAKEFISEFSWLLKSNKKLDLQSTPLIHLDDYYFPLNIFIFSNLFRNTIFKNKIRPHNILKNDNISMNIYETLKSNFNNVAMEVKFNKNGYVGDFDVIAYIDNVIYIFESKNTLTPSDLHELRTTYKDNLIHGFNQLSKCKTVLGIDSYIKDLNNNLKWNIASEFKIVTCLILGTRLYNGYTNGEHHVRSFYELLNFLNNGKIINGLNEEVNLWENDKITGNDIYNFIENRSFHQLIYKSFSTQINQKSLGKYNISFKTFEFNEKDFYDQLIKIYNDVEN